MEQREKNGRIHRDWESVFSEHRESGMTVKAFCEEHGIAQSLFYKWRRRFRDMTEGHGFFELREAGGCAGSGVSVTTGCGFRIDLQPEFDAVTLERVLACLAGGGACSR